MPTFYGPPSDGTVIPSALEDALAADLAAPESLIGAAAHGASVSKLDVADASNAAFKVTGTRVAIGGDSIADGAGASNTATESFWSYLGKIVGTARANVVEEATPGESAAGLLARMPGILSRNPGVFVMMIGMNPSTDLASYKSEVGQILDYTRDARVPTLVCLVTPRRELEEHRTRINTYNLFLRHVASVRGLPIVDTFGPLVDPATGYARPELMADAAHPNSEGHLRLAQAIAPALKAILPPALPLVTAEGGPGLLANSVMAVDATGWNLSAALPGGATHTTTIEAPVPGDGLTSGNWLRLHVDGTSATATSNFLRQQDLIATPAAGDLLLVTAQIKTSDEQPGRVSFQLMDGGSTVVQTIGDGFGTTSPGIQRKIITAPAFASVPRVRFGVSAPAGQTATGYIGAVEVFNLTALGLTELAQ